MSDENNPNRTVFRPSPLQGLRPTPGAAPTAAPSPQPFPPVGDPAPLAAPVAATAAAPVRLRVDDDIPKPATAPNVPILPSCACRPGLFYTFASTLAAMIIR